MAIQSVKLFANGEIRRFPFDGSTKFETLMQKVAQLYPNLSVIKLAWKDNDNDMVSITNDSDLNEAAKHATDGVLQIQLVSTPNNEKLDETVMETEQTKQTEPEDAREQQDPTLHVGVTCDGCGGVVKGMRYKCLTCRDYDLCNTCESKRLHDEHSMIRIVSPKDTIWRKAFFGAQIPFHPEQFRCGNWQRGPRCGFQKPCQEASASANESCADKKADPQGEVHSFLPPNIGEMISTVLTNLGLDLSMDKQPDQGAEGASASSNDSFEKIQKAFDHMTAMGFTNEGGWLKDLLQQKSGDINAVLDLFKPKN